jgi:hypothetical protein
MIRPCIVVNWLNSSGFTKGQHAADHQHREAEQQVHRADVLVVGGEQPAPPAGGGVVVVVVVGVGVVTVLGQHCTHGSLPSGFLMR